MHISHGCNSGDTCNEHLLFLRAHVPTVYALALKSILEGLLYTKPQTVGNRIKDS